MKFNGGIFSSYLALGFIVLFLCSFAYALQKKPEDAIKAIGCFVNVRSDGEHSDGYSVNLWFRGGQIIGLMDYHHGLIGDPPMGIVTDVRYEPSTGKLSFKAKITSGLHGCRIHKDVPSHGLISFQGFLKGDKLEGNILLEERLDSPPVVMDTRTNFLMQKDNDCQMENYRNYDAWWQYWEPIYKRRGAKW